MLLQKVAVHVLVQLSPRCPELFSSKSIFDTIDLVSSIVLFKKRCKLQMWRMVLKLSNLSVISSMNALYMGGTITILLQLMDGDEEGKSETSFTQMYSAQCQYGHRVAEFTSSFLKTISVTG